MVLSSVRFVVHIIALFRVLIKLIQSHKTTKDERRKLYNLQLFIPDLCAGGSFQ